MYLPQLVLGAWGCYHGADKDGEKLQNTSVVFALSKLSQRKEVLLSLHIAYSSDHCIFKRHLTITEIS